MFSVLPRGRPVLVALLHLALMSEPLRADTAPPATATFNLDGRSSSLYQDTREKREPTPLLDSVGDLPFNPALIPSKVPFDGWDLGIDPEDPLGLGSDPQSFVFPSAPGGEHALSEIEARLKTDRDTKASAKLEQALFDNFGREIGMYYGCRSDKDVDWYLKRTFERLKNTIVKYEALTSIKLPESEIAKKITANLGSPLNATSEGYVNKVAEYARRVSSSLVNLRSANGIDWTEPLGGGKGVLRDAGLTTEADEWNKVGSGALFSPPKTDIRGDKICTVKSTAKDRDAANQVMSKKITYDVAKTEGTPAADQAHPGVSPVSKNYEVTQNEKKLDQQEEVTLPAPDDPASAIKTVEKLDPTGALSPAPVTPESVETAPDGKIDLNPTIANVKVDAQEKSKAFWDNWQKKYTYNDYVTIYEACKSRMLIYSVRFKDIPNNGKLVEAFEQNLDRKSICQEACRQIGRSDCYN
jgi:hypothetical protein